MSRINDRKSKKSAIAMMVIGSVIIWLALILSGTWIDVGFSIVFIIIGIIFFILGIIGKKKTEEYNEWVEANQSGDNSAEDVKESDDGQEERIDIDPYLANTTGSLSKFANGTVGNLVYELDGKVTTILQVYEDRCILIAKTTARSFVAGSFLNGTKEFFYEDIVNIQFREATKIYNGYLQFDYQGAMNASVNKGMFGRSNNHASENSFVFSPKCAYSHADGIISGEDEVEKTNQVVGDVYRYIHSKVREARGKKTFEGTIVQQFSAADEIKKYQELLISGAITQEEFDTKKKQLLGL